MKSTSLYFRISNDLASETRAMARFTGLTNCDYVREAVREKNARVMAERIVRLSRKLAEEHVNVNESLIGALADGL